MPVTLITVSSGFFLSVETFCVNGRAHATARRRFLSHFPGDHERAWARSRKTEPRPRRYEAGTLVGQHIDCVTFFAQFCEWLRSRVRSCSRDYGARRVDDWAWAGVLHYMKPSGGSLSACRTLM